MNQTDDRARLDLAFEHHFSPPTMIGGRSTSCRAPIPSDRTNPNFTPQNSTPACSFNLERLRSSESFGCLQKSIHRARESIRVCSSSPRWRKKETAPSRPRLRPNIRVAPPIQRRRPCHHVPGPGTHGWPRDDLNRTNRGTGALLASCGNGRTGRGRNHLRPIRHRGLRPAGCAAGRSISGRSVRRRVTSASILADQSQRRYRVRLSDTYNLLGKLFQHRPTAFETRNLGTIFNSKFTHSTGHLAEIMFGYEAIQPQGPASMAGPEHRRALGEDIRIVAVADFSPSRIAEDGYMPERSSPPDRGVSAPGRLGGSSRWRGAKSLVTFLRMTLEDARRSS